MPMPEDEFRARRKPWTESSNCKNCGKIIVRICRMMDTGLYKGQWNHGDGYERCPPTYAEGPE